MNPVCSCPHGSAFNVARDSNCPVHGTPTVLPEARTTHVECLHTVIEFDTSYGWRCVRCHEPSPP